MDLKAFHTAVADLDEEVLQVVQTHFEKRGLRFNSDAYLAQRSIDSEELAKEAYFYGAELFPEVDD